MLIKNSLVAETFEFGTGIFVNFKGGANSRKIQDTIIYLGQWPISMTQNVCVKFQVNTFDS